MARIFVRADRHHAIDFAQARGQLRRRLRSADLEKDAYSAVRGVAVFRFRPESLSAAVTVHMGAFLPRLLSEVLAVLMLGMGVASPLWIRAIDGAAVKLAAPPPAAAIAVNQ